MSKFTIFLSICLVTLGGALRAQTQGEITGEVTDASGAVMPGVAITVTNENTNVSRQVVTNAAGVYGFPALLPGMYRVQAELSGFQTMLRSGIELQVQQVARIDFRMQVGQVTEVVEVMAGAELLTTESVATGTVIENKRIVNLPLNGRNFLQLVALAPNVSYGFGTAGQQRQMQGGQRSEQNGLSSAASTARISEPASTAAAHAAAASSSTGSCRRPSPSSRP